eukprot:g2476.t1
MQIFVRSDRTQSIEVPKDATVSALREILDEDGEYYFSFGTRVLKEGVPLTQLGLNDSCTVDAHLRLLGGGKKRKKKVYTKPKKPQHKRQHEKLRVLKMYKVDGQKVERLRKQCPKCAPGVFMAMHFDRVYCGQCTLTYLYECEEDN